MNKIVCFSQNWFRKYNKQLCWLANSCIGDFIFKISKMGHDKSGKITEMHPNAITHKQRLLYNFETKKFEQEYTTQFFSRNEYALRLQKVFYPIWLTFHTWDMLIANPFKPAWNLGFDTLTAYPVAGANSPCDGYVKGSGASYATVHSTANYADVTTTTVYIRNSVFAGNYDIRRTGLNFDTSAIGTEPIISSSVLSLYGSSVDSTMPDNINVYGFTPNGTDTIVTGDYSSFGTSIFCDTSIAFGSFSTVAYNDFTLNTAGKDNINKTGVTTFGMRTTKDVSETTPYTGNYIISHSADSGSNKPKLVVTYSVAAEDNSIFFGCNF